jgi:energy-coupling factor transport system ATP-binding protein
MPMFIGAEKLSHTYMPGGPFATEALHDISFRIEKGEIVLIIGPSGSGKSTLIQHLNGLLMPTSGQVIFEDRPISKDRKDLLLLRRRIGLVFQMPEEQFFSETVFDEVAFAPRNLGLDDETVRERVYGALKRVGLVAGQYINRHPFHLSSGQKRLVAIAAVLSLQPEVLILDEPTAGLDPSGRRSLFKLLAAFNRKEDLTVVVSTHHLEEVASLADRVLVLQEGRLVINGSADEVFSRRDELYRLGLALPEVTEIMYDLVAEGLAVNTAVYSLKEARRELNRLIRRENR